MHEWFGEENQTAQRVQMGSALYKNKKAGQINLLRTIRRSQSSQTARKRDQKLAPREKAGLSPELAEGLNLIKTALR